ncbi:SNF2-related protein [Actinomycetaceae bacterium L2_0104]
MRGPVELVGLVGAPTYARGLSYAEQRKTVILQSEPANPDAKVPYPGQRDRRSTYWASGVSRGSRDQNYSVEVEYQLSRHGVVKRMNGWCSCPVGYNCKHAVSLLILDIEGGAEPGGANDLGDSWHETLGSIFGEKDEPLRIALAVDLVEPFSADGGAGRGSFAPAGRRELGTSGSVRMRPMSPGKRSPWITSDVSWKKLGSYGVYRADDRQVEALKALLALYTAASPYGFDGTWVRISDITSAALWPALQEIVNSGVELIEDKTWLPVVLEKEMARADVTIREDATGINLLEGESSTVSAHGSAEAEPVTTEPVTAEPEAAEAEPMTAAQELSALPDPPSPSASTRPETADPSRRNSLTIKAELTHPELESAADAVRIGHPFHGLAWRKEGTIHLARLEAPVASQWLRLANQSEGVRVPAEGREQFEKELLPLISQVGWTSPGRSYIAPPPEDPSLHLVLGLAPASKAGVAPRALLHWSWGPDVAAVELIRSGGTMTATKLPPPAAVGPELAEIRPILRAIEDENERFRKEQRRKRARHRLIPASQDPRRSVATEMRLLADVGEALEAVPRALDGSPAASWAARTMALEEGASNVRFPLQDCELHGIEVVHFLEESLPRIRELGVTVEEVGDMPRFQAAQTPSVQLSVGPGEGGTRDWLDLNVTMKVGEHEIAMPVLLTALTRGDEALFLPSGEYVRLDIPELSKLRELLEEARLLNDRKRSGLRVPKVRTSWWEDLLSLDVVESSTNAWFEAIRGAVQSPPRPASIPTGLTANLRPYQQAGFEWLAHLRRSGLGGVLADDMGLGKTVQTLAMIQDEREERASRRDASHRDREAPGEPGGEDSREADATGPWLVVAPTSVVANWAAEARRFTPGLRVATIESTKKRRGMNLTHMARDVDILITSYTLLRLEYEEYAALRPAGMILDEAQQAKNPASKTFGSLVKIGAPVSFAITGTPMENNLGELWAMFALVAPGLLGNAKQFRENVQKPVEKDASNTEEVLALLRRRISPFLLRRTKSAVASELPEKQEQVIDVELAPGHRRMYDRQLQRERQRVLHLADDLDHNRVEVLSALTRLRQLSIDPALLDPESKAPSSKLETLLPLLQEASQEGHRTLVFSQFTRYLRLIASRLEESGIDYSYLDGSTSNRRAVIEEFATGSQSVFLISLKAGGVGLNLTMADYVVLTDPWWNPAVEDQAVDRTHRIGQTRSVHVYRLVSQDTIEEKVLALQASKRHLIAGVLSSDDGAEASGSVVGGARLSADDLRMLLG